MDFEFSAWNHTYFSQPLLCKFNPTPILVLSLHNGHELSQIHACFFELPFIPFLIFHSVSSRREGCAWTSKVRENMFYRERQIQARGDSVGSATLSVPHLAHTRKRRVMNHASKSSSSSSTCFVWQVFNDSLLLQRHRCNLLSRLIAMRCCKNAAATGRGESRNDPGMDSD
eukprot:3038737-Amphidinium_carterae.1